jgi:ribosomal protein S18 acetylase RimI-like enzyme
MSFSTGSATPTSLPEVTAAVAQWQREGDPVQLHPGDLGWYWRFGADQLAGAVRVWWHDGQIVAVGLVEGSELIRLAIAPGVGRDEAFAVRLLTDLSEDSQIRLVEARFGAAFRALLGDRGWVDDEPWTPLRRELTEPVGDCSLLVETVDAKGVEARVAVHRAAFPRSTFTSEGWHAMAAAPPYQWARCLVGYDDDGTAVAGVTVWSAGPGRPGLLEPLGVHRDHRGPGYGKAISVAAAAALREMGASSATVCTPSSNVGAVAAYSSAGFERLPDVTDFRRPS